jgi:putative FmdB family regulatory protein
MPVYDYECPAGHVTSEKRTYAEREQTLECPECQERAEYVLVRSGIQLGSVERKRGNSRLIFDERQVSSESGSRWRDKGTNGNPGGIGQKVYFHK